MNFKTKFATYLLASITLATPSCSDDDNSLNPQIPDGTEQPGTNPGDKPGDNPQPPVTNECKPYEDLVTQQTAVKNATQTAFQTAYSDSIAKQTALIKIRTDSIAQFKDVENCLQLILGDNDLRDKWLAYTVANGIPVTIDDMAKSMLAFANAQTPATPRINQIKTDASLYLTTVQKIPSYVTALTNATTVVGQKRAANNSALAEFTRREKDLANCRATQKLH